MEIYFSGRIPYEIGGDDWFGIKHYLATYSDMMNKRNMTEFISYFKDKYQKIDLFLDSGAFTAMSLGVKLNLHEYISFVNRYGHMFKLISSLDVIWNPTKSYENFKDMQNHVKYEIIPVFHHTEPWGFLEKYASMTDYIGIGGMANLSSIGRIDFIKKVYQRVKSINRKAKFHAFALGRMPAIRRVGHLIDSVDTTDWLYPIKYANIRNRPKLGKNELNRNQLQNFLRHEVMQFMKLERAINDYIHAHSSEPIGIPIS